MRLLEWALIHFDLCPYKKRRFYDTDKGQRMTMRGHMEKVALASL